MEFSEQLKGIFEEAVGEENPATEQMLKLVRLIENLKIREAVDCFNGMAMNEAGDGLPEKWYLEFKAMTQDQRDAYIEFVSHVQAWASSIKPQTSEKEFKGMWQNMGPYYDVIEAIG